MSTRVFHVNDGDYKTCLHRGAAGEMNGILVARLPFCSARQEQTRHDGFGYPLAPILNEHEPQGKRPASRRSIYSPGVRATELNYLALVFGRFRGPPVPPLFRVHRRPSARHQGCTTVPSQFLFEIGLIVRANGTPIIKRSSTRCPAAG